MVSPHWITGHTQHGRTSSHVVETCGPALTGQQLSGVPILLRQRKHHPAGELTGLSCKEPGSDRLSRRLVRRPQLRQTCSRRPNGRACVLRGGVQQRVSKQAKRKRRGEKERMEKKILMAMSKQECRRSHRHCASPQTPPCPKTPCRAAISPPPLPATPPHPQLRWPAAAAAGRRSPAGRSARQRRASNAGGLAAASERAVAKVRPSGRHLHLVGAAERAWPPGDAPAFKIRVWSFGERGSVFRCKRTLRRWKPTSFFTSFGHTYHRKTSSSRTTTFEREFSSDSHCGSRVAAGGTCSTVPRWRAAVV